MSFDIASLSRTGGRSANEDYADFLQTDTASCWVLADGLGGHRGGATASKAVVEAVLASFRARPEISAEAVRAHVERAQESLLAAQTADPSLSQMRSTIVVLVSGDREAVWAHVGDSRLYHLRGGQVVDRTRDHSVSQALVDGGQIDAHDQGAHEDRSRLLRCLGKEGEADATVDGPHALARGDVFLLCTDGFWEALDDVEMELDLAGAEDAAAWLDRLEARLRRQIGPSHDNYTATAIRITGDAAPVALAHDPQRPVEAPWRQAAAAVSVGPSDRPAEDAPRRAMFGLGDVPPAAIAAAAAVIVFALLATGVWQRHAVMAWMKSFVAAKGDATKADTPKPEPKPAETPKPEERKVDTIKTPTPKPPTDRSAAPATPDANKKPKDEPRDKNAPLNEGRKPPHEDRP